MLELISFVFTSILISILFIIPGVLFESWLEKEGIARGDKTVIVITTIFLVAVKQLWFKDVSWWWGGLFIMLALALSVHRRDMTETWKRGRWWWKQEKKGKKKKP
jgi:hypothetical protein